MTNLPTEHETSSLICPFLGTITEDGGVGLPVDYPSFENHCLVSQRREGLMLTDQATFCLSRGHRYCPRFVANRATAPQHTTASIEFEPKGRSDSTLGSALFTDSLQDLEAEIQSGFRAQQSYGRRWGWFGAALIFVICVLCGGSSAAYIGWQLVNRNLIAVQPGDLDMLASIPTPAPPQIYLVVTATTDPPAGAIRAPVAVAPNDQQSSAPLQPYPEAVTPTPVKLGAAAQPPANIESQSAQSPATIPQIAQSQASVIAADTPPNPTSAIVSNIDLQVPTRRPTPEFDLPTSTANPTPDTPTPTSTPIPFLGPPIVLFSADDSSLLSGKCTMVSWHVENVREVYYEDLGVDGHGEREECVDDRDGEYTLTVVLQDGRTRTYTTTVEMLEPTNTPAPSPTFTPKPVATVTWTPVIPTDTPTPDLEYGAQLAVDGGSEVECTVAETCEIGLLVTNSSKAIDTLILVFTERSAWSSRFCRMDGVCSESELALVNVGPSNTAYVHLVVEVTGDTDQSTGTYGALVLSEGSNRTKSSSPVSITVVRLAEGE